MNRFLPIDESIDSNMQSFYDYLNKMSKVLTINTIDNKRLEQLHTCLQEVTKIAKSTSPDAKIEMSINDALNTGMACIRIDTDEFTIKNVDSYIKAIKGVSNIDSYPLENGKIRYDFSFKNVMKVIENI